MRIKSLSFLSLLILFGCSFNSKPPVTSTTTPSVTSGSNGSPIFNARKVNPGDIIAGLDIEQIDVNPIDDDNYYAVVKFTGLMTVSGELSFTQGSDEGWGLGNYFEPDEGSKNRIPIINIEPDRNGFTLNDNANEELLHMREEHTKYKVELEVDNYEIWSNGKGQENKARLIKIVKSNKVKSNNVDLPLKEYSLFTGKNGDEIIDVLVGASLDPESKFYRTSILIMNKASEMIDIVADCGSYVSYLENFEAEGNNCLAVESMGIYKNSDVRSIIEIPKKYFMKN